MQKKSLGLALALAFGTFGSAAVAQSNVQIYGAVDYGYSYRFNANSLLKNDGSGVSHAKSIGRIDSGQSTDNMLGIKGVEEIGNGTKAFFVLERAFFLDTGADDDGFNLSAYVGLETPMGSLVGGRIVTPYHELLSGVDPFAAGTVGTYQNVKKDIAENEFGEAGLFDPDRVNNAIAYVSPDFGGFSFTLAYSNDAFDDDGSYILEVTDAGKVTETTRYTNSQDNAVYTIGANYATDNALIGATYHRIHSAALKAYGTNADFVPVKSVDNFSLGGFYDFGVLKLAAFYSMDKAKFGTEAGTQVFTPDGKTSATQHNFMIGANIPFGKSELKASVNYSKNASSQFGDAMQIAVGYDYNFSKRTAFYAAYAWIDNDGATGSDTTGRIGRAAVVNDTQNSGGIYQQAFQLGIRHQF